MTRYDPRTVFPLFVLIVVILGTFYAVRTKSQMQDQSLADIHIVEPSPNTSEINPPVGIAKTKLTEPLPALQHPDAKLISESPNSIRLESLIDIETITNWYREKVKSLGYTSKSDVKANSNGNMENRILGTKDNTELYIEIKKPNGFAKTAINIELANP